MNSIKLSLSAVIFLGVSLSFACGGSSNEAEPSPQPTSARAVAPTNVPATVAPTVVPTAAAVVVPTEAPASQVPAATSPPQIQPTARPAPTNPPAPTQPRPPAAPVRIEVRANNEQWDKSELRAPAGAQVTAQMHNDEVGVDHNLTFNLPGLDHGDTCKGPCTRSQTFTAPSAPGAYLFFCTIHPMNGNFIIE